MSFPTEVLRLFLYLVEWSLSLLVFALFPLSLSPSMQACALSSPAFCRNTAVLAFLALILISLVGVWHSLTFCTPYALPLPAEVGLLHFLALLWLGTAIALSVATVDPDIADATSAARRCVRAAAWVQVGLYWTSATVAWRVDSNERDIEDEFDTMRRDKESTDPVIKFIL